MVFWPSWAELQRICDRLSAGRIALRKALQAALEPQPNPIYLGRREPESRAQRLRASIDSYLRHNRPVDAVRVEKKLAAEEGRKPENWAHEVQASAPPPSMKLPDIPKI